MRSKKCLGLIYTEGFNSHFFLNKIKGALKNYCHGTNFVNSIIMIQTKAAYTQIYMTLVCMQSLVESFSLAFFSLYKIKRSSSKMNRTSLYSVQINRDCLINKKKRYRSK